MTALCADPAYDPDWWSVDADPYDRMVANGICSRCPQRRDCAVRAASMPGTFGLWGCRWFPEPSEDESDAVEKSPGRLTSAQRLAAAELRLAAIDPDDPSIFAARQAVLGLI